MNSLPIILGAIAVALILGIGATLALFYNRAERGVALVRNGFGGPKVCIDGGLIVLPVLQTLQKVNMRTLALTVSRTNEHGLLTLDNMRADIDAEFFVRVSADEASIGLAAQTLGEAVNDKAKLSQLIEAKFVDALRSVASKMDLQTLQVNRADFSENVRNAVASGLQPNGLELEDVSLTRLDQTDRRYFNQDNFFDSQGLTKLTQVTQDRLKERNDIEQETKVQIQTRNLEARRREIEIERSEREAVLQQSRDVDNMTSQTRAESAKAEQSAQRLENEFRIEREQAIAEAEARAGRNKENARIEAERDVRLAAQEAEIQVSIKSQAEHEAKGEAEKARAIAVAETARVDTALAVEIAERGKRIAIIDAEQEASVEATAVRISAEAEQEAAEKLADAVRTRAKGDSEAAALKAQGIIEIGRAEAQAEELMNEARNKLGKDIIELEVVRERMRIIPAALAEIVKPMEKISDIKIFSGSPFAGGGEGGSGAGFGEGISGELLRHSTLKPVYDRFLAEAGFVGTGQDALLGALTGSPVVVEPTGAETQPTAA